MKTVKIIIVAFLAIVISSTVYSQSVTTKTETIKVWGNLLRVVWKVQPMNARNPAIM